MSATAWPGIELDLAGVAHVEGTRTKVIEIALDRIAHHWDADEIQRQHPHLTLPQIHAALGYYYEHRVECDRLITERTQVAEEFQQRLEDADFQRQLRARAAE